MKTDKVKVTLEKDSKGKYRWSIKAKNGRIVGASSQGYRRKNDCIYNLAFVTNLKLDVEYNMEVTNA